MSKDDVQALWHQAKEVFKGYVDQPAHISINDVERRSDLSEAIKVKVIRLIQALKKSKTILQNADSGALFNQIKMLSDLTGQTIDHYQLTELIAVGGMSSIYQAQRIDSEVQKPVAIKVLSIQSESTDVVALFARELKALSKLNHQNIVSFYHGGESSSGVYYLVMELLDGATCLGQYIEQQKCDIRSIVQLINQVALAMVNAHDHLIIHGDLKVDNILVDANDQLKVVDFGIAAFTYQNHQQSIPVYTPSIAAPEQIKGDNITIKSDVFSLGATLLQLCSQQSPQPDFEHDQYDELAMIKHVGQVLSDSLLDRDLCAIIKKSMQADPANRYATMNAFAVDLNNWLSGKPVNAVDGGVSYQLKKFALRNKLLTSGIAILISLLLVTFMLIQNYAFTARQEADKAQTTLDFMTRVLSQADPAHLDQGNITIRDAFKITLDQSSEFLENNPESQIEILTQVADIYTQLALYSEAATTAEKIYRAYVMTEGALSENALYWLYEAAGHYHAAGVFDKCLKVGHQVIEQLTDNKLPYHSVRLNALNTIIKCHVERFENELAYEYMNVAQNLMESGVINDTEALGRTYNSFAVITRRLHEFELSENFYRRSLLNIENSLGKDNTAYCTILNGFGRMYMLQGKYEVARPYLEESMQRVRAFDPDSHVLARNMSYYAKYLFHTGAKESAIKTLDEAAIIAKKRKHQFTLMIIQDLRFKYNTIMGNYITSLDSSQARLQSGLQMYGLNHPRVTRYINQMAGLLSLIGKIEMANHLWQEQINYFLSEAKDHQSELSVIYAYMGLHAIDRGDFKSAESFYQQAKVLSSNEQVTELLSLLINNKELSELKLTDEADLLSLTKNAYLVQQQSIDQQNQCELTEEILYGDDLILKKLFLKACTAKSQDSQIMLKQLDAALKNAQIDFTEQEAGYVDGVIESIRMIKQQ